MTWAAVHIFFLIGFRNRLAVMLAWIWKYFHIHARRAADHRRPAAAGMAGAGERRDLKRWYRGRKATDRGREKTRSKGGKPGVRNAPKWSVLRNCRNPIRWRLALNILILFILRDTSEVWLHRRTATAENCSESDAVAAAAAKAGRSSLVCWPSREKGLPTP